MKSIHILFLLSCTILLSNCKKEESTSSEEQKQDLTIASVNCSGKAFYLKNGGKGEFIDTDGNLHATSFTNPYGYTIHPDNITLSTFTKITDTYLLFKEYSEDYPYICDLSTEEVEKFPLDYQNIHKNNQSADQVYFTEGSSSMKELIKTTISSLHNISFEKLLYHNNHFQKIYTDKDGNIIWNNKYIRYVSNGLCNEIRIDNSTIKHFWTNTSGKNYLILDTYNEEERDYQFDLHQLHIENNSYSTQLISENFITRSHTPFTYIAGSNSSSILLQSNNPIIIIRNDNSISELTIPDLRYPKVLTESDNYLYLKNEYPDNNNIYRLSKSDFSYSTMPELADGDFIVKEATATSDDVILAVGKFSSGPYYTIFLLDQNANRKIIKQLLNEPPYIMLSLK